MPHLTLILCRQLELAHTEILIFIWLRVLVTLIFFHLVCSTGYLRFPHAEQVLQIVTWPLLAVQDPKNLFC
jgi:hypothetical protein